MGGRENNINNYNSSCVHFRMFANIDYRGIRSNVPLPTRLYVLNYQITAVVHDLKVNLMILWALEMLY